MTAAARLAELDEAAVAWLAGLRPDPAAERTLRVFLDQLAGVLGDPARAAEAEVLVSRLEDYLEALLVREGWR